MTTKLARKTTSLRVEPHLWKKVKVHCAQREVDISDYIEELIEADLNPKRYKELQERIENVKKGKVLSTKEMEEELFKE